MTQDQINFINYLTAGAKRGFTQYGILASITIAQACIESGWGSSNVARNDKNLFGIKMPGTHPANINITQGSLANDGGYYRRYQSWDDSILDHGLFLNANSRYHNIIGQTDYAYVAQQLQNDGYAEDQGYASSLIGMIRDYNLSQIDSGSTYSGVTANETATDDGTNIVTTNYEIVPGSAQSGDILYGRRYRVIVSSLDGEKALDVSNLRCTFNCFRTIQLQPQYSEIVIYNLSPQSENAIINEGYRVIVEAGYEGNQYGVIFDGNVVQAIRNKENGTTYTLTLVGADSDMWLSYSVSAFTMVRGQNSRAVIDNCASKATIPIDLGNISSGLSDSKLTRGKVVFGLTRDYLRQIAQSENATLYVENGKVNIIKATDIPEGEIIDLSPTTGLLGVPVQQDYGVTIQCLLNPRIRLNSLVHVDNSLVRNQKFDQGQPLFNLDQDGIYRVIQLNHIGDTRGNDWYCQLATVKQSGVIPDMQVDGKQYYW